VIVQQVESYFFCLRFCLVFDFAECAVLSPCSVPGAGVWSAPWFQHRYSVKDAEAAQFIMDFECLLRAHSRTRFSLQILVRIVAGMILEIPDQKAQDFLIQLFIIGGFLNTHIRCSVKYM
jgi:hypothetical protein